MALSKQLVNAVLHDERQHKENEIAVGRETVKRCELYPSISCDDHVNVYNKGRNAFSDVKGTPTTVIAAPDGKEIARVVGNNIAGVQKAMEDAIKQVGPGIPLGDWKKIKSDLAEADAYLDAGKAKRAIAEYKKLAKAKFDSVKAMGEDGLGRANEAGMKAIEEALEGEDDAAAAKALKKIAGEFAGTEAGDKAKEAAKDPAGARGGE